MKNKRTRYSIAPPDAAVFRPLRERRRRIFLLLAMMLTALNVGAAQDLIINGTMSNTGTIRVKNQTITAQAVFGGELELFGQDQVLPAKQYQNVRLTGTGVKTTAGGSFTVFKSLTIAAPVTLEITKGTSITLGDTLFESGYVKGAIQKTVNLSGGTTSSDFGQIGASITGAVTEPGNTTIMRVSDSTQFGQGNQSIRRYYDIQLTDATKTGTVTFKYAESELNGHDINHLQLWRSLDNGQNWVRYIPVVDTLLKTLSTSTNVAVKGLWTAADTLRALGPLKGGAGIPAMIAKAGIIDTLPVILTTLDTIKVQITDLFGMPVANVPVSFAAQKPPTATGDTLTNTLDSTDASGIATTVYTLGNKVGDYVVTATSGDLDTVRITATAQNGAPQTLSEVPITLQTKQILTMLDSLFIVEVKDIGGNPVDSAMVKFSINSIPSEIAFDQDLSVDSIRTDGLGRASTRLTLGSKVGSYGVKATVIGLNDSAQFSATATPGAAASMIRGNGNDQVGIVGTAVSPFVVTLLDVGDNPVPNEPVKFSIASFPGGLDSGSLSATTISTDGQGSASSIFTLGKKSGYYVVTAQNTTSGGTLAYSVKAEASAPKSLAEISGNDQQRTILSALTSDFVVAVRDTFGNAVDSAMVVFRIDSLLANGSGARLSVDSLLSDTSGLASTRLTLGSKSGLYAVNATVNGIPVLTFNANASPGAVVAMAPSAGENQIDTILTGLDELFTVRIVDVGGNGVPDKSVQFSITGRPDGDTVAVLSTTGIRTDSSGFASTRLTLGSKVGTYTVKASIDTPAALAQRGRMKIANDAALEPIETIFTAEARHGAASAMLALFGDRQINPTETELDTALVVALRDIGGNPVMNEPVIFKLDSVPLNAANQILRDTLVLTDSSGIARTFLTLGTREGQYRVRATAGNALVAQFIADAYFIYGDINKDIDINIADITSLVDILNKKIIPTTSDSLKADFNRDNRIDTLDIGTIRSSILDRSIFTPSPAPSAFLEEENNAGYIAPVVKVQKKYTAAAKTVLEATPYGLRVNLFNDEPVRGIELRLKLKDSTLLINTVNMLFKRAQMMDVFVSTKAHEVRVVAYNLSNTEIQPDSGSIFRLPMITDLAMIDTSEVTIALQSNSAAPVSTEKVTAPAGVYPASFRLSQNYPNPFNGSTTIEYDIPDGTERTKTVIQVFNILGQRVKTLVSEEQQPGRYSIRWNGTDQNGNVVSTGVYFYRLISQSHVGSRKMLYVK